LPFVMLCMRNRISQQSNSLGCEFRLRSTHTGENIRVDTHKDNISMKRILIKKGFQYCGVIYNQWGDERLAFQRV
nr:hypothetical protein [Desulfobacteraceae bacterium]